MIAMVTQKTLLLAPAFVSVSLLLQGVAYGATYYGYDPNGRVVTALYDNGLCTIYAYDANGNRTSQTSAIGGSPASPVWGTGVWGCFNWTP
jgi:YD repeat-containing protein